jgi:16S rRNA (cytosine1402-N4)-methyltransferase
MSSIHTPVMLQEVLDAWVSNPDGLYLDATFGRGGHSMALLQRLSPKGRLIVLDRDDDAFKAAEALASKDARVKAYHLPFSELLSVLPEKHCVDGILFDLGVSSAQLDQAERGFSFQKDGPLDMRMDRRQTLSASEWLAQVEEKKLAEVLRLLGQERHANRIAHAIVLQRKNKPFTRTLALADLIASLLPKAGKKHPATRSFQAIRMFINQELAQLETALQDSWFALAKGGHLVVLSFHSGEDSLVKHMLHGDSQHPKRRMQIPSRGAEGWKRLKVAKKPSALEVAANVRARSVVLRAASRC